MRSPPCHAVAWWRSTAARRSSRGSVASSGGRTASAFGSGSASVWVRDAVDDPVAELGGRGLGSDMGRSWLATVGVSIESTAPGQFAQGEEIRGGCCDGRYKVVARPQPSHGYTGG